MRTAFLKTHPTIVKAWLTAHVAVTQWEIDHPDEAQALLNREIEKLTGKRLRDEVLKQAWARLRPTWDPIVSSLMGSANAAYAAGFLKTKPNLDAIYDLSLLNEVLRAKNLPEVHLENQ